MVHDAIIRNPDCGFSKVNEAPFFFFNVHFVHPKCGFRGFRSWVFLIVWTCMGLNADLHSVPSATGLSLALHELAASSTMLQLFSFFYLASFLPSWGEFDMNISRFESSTNFASESRIVQLDQTRILSAKSTIFEQIQQGNNGQPSLAVSYSTEFRVHFALQTRQQHTPAPPSGSWSNPS